jgi:hypothetical protein
MNFASRLGDLGDGNVGAELVLKPGERERVHPVAGRGEVAL